MGQAEVVEWLLKMRRSGEHKYWSVGEIREGLKIKGYGYLNTDLQVSQLYHYGVLDMRTSYDGGIKRKYRIKLKYVGYKL